MYTTSTSQMRLAEDVREALSALRALSTFCLKGKTDETVKPRQRSTL